MSSRPFALGVVLVLACGGAAAPPPEEPRPLPPAPDEEPDDGMQVEGQTGSISQMAVESAMGTHLERLGGCYRQALGGSPFLLGDVILSFRIARDGSVRVVFPLSSTIGHQATQACLVERARGIRFARPVGGEAEASYPLAFNPGSGRPPDLWPAERVAEAIAEHRAEIDACGVSGEGYSLTMYVEPGGRVTSAGVSYPAPDGGEAADCVARAAAAWTLPDPGSWMAKVTVDL
jgi:hypothetical protein